MVPVARPTIRPEIEDDKCLIQAYSRTCWDVYASLRTFFHPLQAIGLGDGTETAFRVAGRPPAGGISRQPVYQLRLPAIWEVPGGLWERIYPVILEMDPPKSTGRRCVHPKGIPDGIIFRLCSGCQWNRLPRELGDGSAIHRTFRRWVQREVLKRIRP